MILPSASGQAEADAWAGYCRRPASPPVRSVTGRRDLRS